MGAIILLAWSAHNVGHCMHSLAAHSTGARHLAIAVVAMTPSSCVDALQLAGTGVQAARGQAHEANEISFPRLGVVVTLPRGRPRRETWQADDLLLQFAAPGGPPGRECAITLARERWRPPTDAEVDFDNGTLVVRSWRGHVPGSSYTISERGRRATCWFSVAGAEPPCARPICRSLRFDD